MRAKDCKIQLLVTADFVLFDDSRDAQFVDSYVEKIRERIISQLSGHRTPERLADHVTVTTVSVHTIGREL